MNLKEARELVKTHATDLVQVCPHCGAKAHIQSLWNDSHKFKNKDVEFYIVFRCKPCEKLILRTFLLKQNRYRDEEDLELDGWQGTFPMSLDNQLGPEEKEFIPTDILLDYQEALKCKAIGANRAGCAMFRRGLQGALVKLGADPTVDLIRQISSLETLPSDIKDWAHQIRIFGNWGAHPDKDNLKEVAPDDVAEAHDFTSKFLLYTFIMPEKVKLSREKRDKKVKSGDSAKADGADTR
jgi:hypothetical protein